LQFASRFVKDVDDNDDDDEMFVMVQHDSITDSQWRRCSQQSTVWYVSLVTDQRPRCMRSFTPHHHHHHHHQVIL